MVDVRVVECAVFKLCLENWSIWLNRMMTTIRGGII